MDFLPVLEIPIYQRENWREGGLNPPTPVYEGIKAETPWWRSPETSCGYKESRMGGKVGGTPAET